MKICVVGAGNAGVITALHYAHYTREIQGIEIELVYDPEIPVVPVGQGTLLDVTNLLWLSLGTDWHTNKIKATPKLGVLYENWGKKNKKFFHAFPMHNIAAHYDPETLQNYILNSGLFRVRHENIDDLYKIDADVIFDCRGNKDKDDSNYEDVLNPLNSCLLATSEKKDPNQFWTRAVATPDGWSFVIPNTTDTTSYGYLFNTNYTTQAEAESNFSDIFRKDFPDGIDSQKLDFTSYVAKESVTIEGGRATILNGNRLAFVEPLEATSTALYLDQARYSFDYLINREGPYHDINQRIRKKFKAQCTFILWHYLKGSRYKTSFWDHAMQLAEFGIDETDTDFFNIMNTIKNDNGVNLRDINRYPSLASYGSWTYWSFKNWHENVIC